MPNETKKKKQKNIHRNFKFIRDLPICKKKTTKNQKSNAEHAASRLKVLKYLN